MRKNNTALLVIDAQIDFHDVPGASLPVPGAVKDTERIAAFIRKNVPGAILASQDSHYALDIAHPAWFNDAKGNPVDVFTLIQADDIKNGKYTPRIDPVGTLKYVEALEANGEFLHFIWPVHCEIGTPGQSFHPIFTEVIREWSLKQARWVYFIRKGQNPKTEHFGIFRANVPDPSDASTDIDQEIFTLLNQMDTVYLTGQARTHCVANSLRQLIEIAPNLASKLVVLTDTMSDVAGLPADFYTHVDSIYSNAEKMGVRMVKSTDI